MLIEHARRAAFAIGLLALASPAAAERFTIMDEEGFKTRMEAVSLDLPNGWAAEGRVAWRKPCSGNPLYEVILNARSPDGASGVRMMPGHTVQWLDMSVDASVDPMIARLAAADSEARRNKMRTAFRNSNCHVGQVANSEAIIAALILPRRPAGARIERIVPDARKLEIYKASFRAPIAGMNISYDAVIVDLAYPRGGGETVERLWLSWSQFSDDPRANYMPGLPSSHFQFTTIDGINLAYAPRGRAADLDRLAQILSGARAEAQWRESIQEVQREIAKSRGMTEEERKQREMQQELEQQRFIEMIQGAP